MPTVQELLTELRQHTDQERSAAQIRGIVRAVNELDTLLAAYFPPTKQWFITKEQNALTAAVFSNRDSFDRFAERCAEQGLYPEAVENPRAERAALFTDLIRCGFTHVLIDYAPEFIELSITRFCEIPDMSDVPLLQRPFPAPALTGRIHYLFQQIASGKADGGMELDVLRELYHSPLLMPVQQTEKDTYQIFAAEQNGRRMAQLFTDRVEWTRAGVPDSFSPAVARFAELQTILDSGFDCIAVNPGSGAELVLDAQLLNAAEQAVMVGVQEFDLQTMQEQGEKLTVSDPDPVPEALAAALKSVLEQDKTVTAAYLRVLKQENRLHPSWLVLLDRTEDRGRKQLHAALHAAALPHLGSNNLEFADYHAAAKLAGNAKPFYQRKRRGLFR